MFIRNIFLSTLLIPSAFFICSCGCRVFNVSTMSCETDAGTQTAESTPACTTVQDTSIKGVENDQWTTLDAAGNWNSQIHLQAVNGKGGFESLRWEILANRQTCSSGMISGSGNESYLQISSSPTAFYMQVRPGKNYIDYSAYGCKNDGCVTLVERGTIVLDVNYVP